MRRAWAGCWSSKTPAASRDPGAQAAWSKDAFFFYTPGVSTFSSRPLYAELGSPILDQERNPIAEAPMLMLPRPFLDLDPAFIHQHWAFDINTSRRSDHSLRYGVTFGPLAALLQQECSSQHTGLLGTQPATQAVGAAGPSLRQLLTVTS